MGLKKQQGSMIFEIMVAIVVVAIVEIIVIAYINHDDDAPALTGVTVSSATQACLSSTILMNFVVRDPDFWYQDDTGVASATVNGATWTFAKEFFKVTLPASYTKSSCAATDTFNVTATDHNSNSSGSSVTISNLPQAYCCNAAQAQANNCSC